jgi:uncharacterized protein DUF4440
MTWLGWEERAWRTGIRSWKGAQAESLRHFFGGGTMNTLRAMLIAAAVLISGALVPGRSNTTGMAQPVEVRDPGAADNPLAPQILAKEHEMTEALKADNLEAFGKLIAEEALFVDARGPASKMQVMKNVAGFTLSEYAVGEVAFLPLSSKSGLITYKMHEKGNSHGKEFDAEVYVSSMWEKRGKDWVCLFSQETAAK